MERAGSRRAAEGTSSKWRVAVRSRAQGRRKGGRAAAAAVAAAVWGVREDAAVEESGARVALKAAAWWGAGVAVTGPAEGVEGTQTGSAKREGVQGAVGIAGTVGIC